LVIPQRFVQWREGRAGVFVNDHGRAKWRAITLGLRGRESVEVTQGLSPGERVVAPREAKQPPLTDGHRVSVPETGGGIAEGAK
jgi:HlyD family secretion protein